MLSPDKPKRDISQWRVKTAPCQAGCGREIEYRLRPKKFCADCADTAGSQSATAKRQREHRKRIAQGHTGYPFICGGCGQAKLGKVPQCKFCDECRPEARRQYSAAKNAANGSIPLGSEVECPNCKISCIKRFKASNYCDECRKLSQRENLPWQLDRKRAWFAKYGRDRRKRDPKFAMNYRMNANIKNSLRDGKNGRRWEALVGYTITDLMAHLEAQFLPGMSWDNRGEWHIDHIRPLCSFSFQTPDDPQFREAWALTNLQPLWAADNLKKGGRWAA